MFIIRIQENGKRREQTVCSCPSLEGTKHIVRGLSSEYTNHWIRVYRTVDDTRKGTIVYDIFSGGALRTNDKITRGVLLDDLTVMPRSMSKVEPTPHVSASVKLRRGKGRYGGRVKKKKPTRYHDSK